MGHAGFDEGIGEELCLRKTVISGEGAKTAVILRGPSDANIGLEPYIFATPFPKRGKGWDRG